MDEEDRVGKVERRETLSEVVTWCWNLGSIGLYCTDERSCWMPQGGAECAF